ncbi:tetratricopeptide repeat protein [Hydrogenovibrio halophilus]|uniref:tetratricopeptide repeat protein n=1 Tax=Hydrogenovibrio halophilus TaxID=373391 RepID=UPI000382A0DC|nr:tetratricopeptide repeat protein [Hydrogenovibrio halophilus]
MSVLLEALKKAANEKKRTDPAVSQHEPEEAHTSRPSREAMNQTLARDRKPPRVQPSSRNPTEKPSNEGTVSQSEVSASALDSAPAELLDETPAEATSDPELASPPEPESESGPEPAVSPGATEGALTLRTEDAAPESPLSEPSGADEPDVSQDSHQQAALAATEDEASVKSAPAASEETGFTLREQNDSASPGDGSSQALDLETRLALASDDASSFEAERGAFSETGESESEPDSGSDQTPEPESSSAFSDETVEETGAQRSDNPLPAQGSETTEVDEADKVDMATADSSQSRASEPVEKAADSDAQNEWSLSKIPGYANNEAPRKPVSEKKSRQWLQVMQSGQRQPSRRYRWVLGLLIALLVATGLLVFGFLYFYQSQSQLDQSLARYQLPLPENSNQADQPTSVTLPEEVVDASPDSATDSAEQAREARQEPAAEPSTERLSERTSEASEANGVSETAEQKQTSAPTATEAKPSASQEMDAPSESTAEPPSQAPDSSSERPSRTEETQDAARPSQRLSIRSDGASQTLKSAYAAYQRGQWQEAKSHYQTLLRQEPENLAAMMGIAAVHVKEQAYSKAMQSYQKILRLHPGNENALAAQAALAGVFAQNPDNIRQLKNWAQKWPDQPQLQAALGRYYAQNRDWLQAQSHFFKAFELVPKKADYAHNLAVSLDQLGKYRLARDYYRKALTLSESALSAPQQASIRARIDVLNQFLSEES